MSIETWVMLQKNGFFFGKVCVQLWWFKKNAELLMMAGHDQTLFYQHNGVHPHTAKANEQYWSQHGAKKGFNIQVVMQAAQSPDLNRNDLGFFASLHSDIELVVKKNMTDLVVHSWDAYPKDRMVAVWSTVCFTKWNHPSTW